MSSIQDHSLQVPTLHAGLSGSIVLAGDMGYEEGCSCDRILWQTSMILKQEDEGEHAGSGEPRNKRAITGYARDTSQGS